MSIIKTKREWGVFYDLRLTDFLQTYTHYKLCKRPQVVLLAETETLDTL